MRTKSNLTEFKRIVGLLKTTIHEENQALLDADYQQLDDLGALKLRYAEDLENVLQQIISHETPSSLRDILRPLQQAVQRNDKLLAAALNGASSARRRFEDSARFDCKVGAYDRDSNALHIEEQGRIANKMV